MSELGDAIRRLPSETVDRRNALAARVDELDEAWRKEAQHQADEVKRLKRALANIMLVASGIGNDEGEEIRKQVEWGLDRKESVPGPEGLEPARQFFYKIGPENEGFKDEGGNIFSHALAVGKEKPSAGNSGPRPKCKLCLRELGTPHEDGCPTLIGARAPRFVAQYQCGDPVVDPE